MEGERQAEASDRGDCERLPAGRVDIHSHMLPGVDDGCADVRETVASVRQLIRAGYVGTICTPHVWPDMFPENTVENIARWTQAVREGLRGYGLDYAVWPGGELRMWDGVHEWLAHWGVPTLAGSKYVLMDFWDAKWPKWLDRELDWLQGQGYQPVLAHPERIAPQRKLLKHIEAVLERGVLLQGNLRCMTGEEGPAADAMVRQLLDAGRYTFLALDMHRPRDLDSRLDGLALVEREYGGGALDQLTAGNPREMILGQRSASGDGEQFL